MTLAALFAAFFAPFAPFFFIINSVEFRVSNVLESWGTTMEVSKMKWLIFLIVAVAACAPTPPKKEFNFRFTPGPVYDVDAIFPPKQKPINCTTIDYGGGVSSTSCY